MDATSLSTMLSTMREALACTEQLYEEQRQRADGLQQELMDCQAKLLVQGGRLEFLETAHKELYKKMEGQQRNVEEAMQLSVEHMGNAMQYHRLSVFVTEELPEVLNVWMTERLASLQRLQETISSLGTKVMAHFQGLNHRIAKYEQVLNLYEEDMVSLRRQQILNQEEVFRQKEHAAAQSQRHLLEVQALTEKFSTDKAQVLVQLRETRLAQQREIMELGAQLTVKSSGQQAAELYRKKLQRATAEKQELALRVQRYEKQGLH